jgi:hypothetical protein
MREEMASLNAVGSHRPTRGQNNLRHRTSPTGKPLGTSPAALTKRTDHHPPTQICPDQSSSVNNSRNQLTKKRQRFPVGSAAAHENVTLPAANGTNRPNTTPDTRNSYANKCGA